MTTRWWRPPDAPLRSSAAVAAGVGLAGVAVLGLWIGAAFETASRYPFLAAAMFAGVMTIAWTRMGSAHPFSRFGAANQVTTVRAAAVALAAALIAEPATSERAWLIVSLTVCVAALDGVDGWLARRTRMASRFGARFDMEIDALFILVLAVLVWQFDKAGPWVLGCGLMRYLFVAAAWLLPWMAGPLRPTRRAKIVAVVQLAGLGGALAPMVRPPASEVMAALTLAALAWSFAVDVGRLWRA